MKDLRNAANGSRPRGRRRRATLGAALLVAGIGSLVWAASMRVPCGPAEGHALEAPESTQSGAAEATRRGSFRVATFNIHGGKGTDGVRDLARTAQCLEGFDLIGLNEVRGRYFWQQADQAETVGRTLDMPWLFAPAERRWWHYDFGSALLTTLPVSHWQRIGLARTGGKTYRNLLLAGLECDGQKINVVITHLDSRDPQRRQAQMRAVGELFLSLAEPAILLGDLNATADDPQIGRVLAAPGVVDALAGVRDERACGHIDWILARGLRTVDAGVLDRGASDHACFWAEFALSPAPRLTGRDDRGSSPRP